MSSTYEMKPGQGSAFKNDKKTESWHPAYRGKVMLPNGQVHWLDVSPKKTKAGGTWLAIKVGNPVTGGAGQAVPVTASVGEADDDIPF